MHLVEEEANKPWEYGSGKPLFRWIGSTLGEIILIIIFHRNVLLKIIGGYVAINTYHHAAGDGTSGMIIINSILSNYDILYNGGSLVSRSNRPLPSIEDLTASVRKDQDIQALVDSKVERARTYRPVLPFSLEEMETNSAQEVPLNKAIIRTGDPGNYQAIRWQL